MRHIITLAVPAAIGVAAAFLQFNSTTGVTEYEYCQVTSSPDNLTLATTKLELEGDDETNGRIERVVFTEEIPKAVPWSDRGYLVGTPLTRVPQAGDLLFFHDLAEQKSRLAAPGKISVSVPIDNRDYEASFLRVGKKIGFVIDSFNGETDSQRFEVIGPFKLLSVGKVVTESLGIDDDTRPSVCIEAAKDLSDLQILLQAIQDEAILSVAFDIDDVQ
jgi:hypothetical protein